MYYIEMKNGLAVSATLSPSAHTLAIPGLYETRNEWKTFERAEQIAKELTAVAGHWIATDAGAHTYPRYDVSLAPMIGELVSCSFNGDSRPCGIITSVSKTLKKVVTSDGSKFYRRRQSGAWIKNGTWSMISGHHNQRNPSF